MAKVLYLSIVEDIKNKIMANELHPGDMLKSESELMKEYNVSRMTLRKSLSLLSNEGYVYSVPGKGNYICQPDTDVFQFHLDNYSSFIPDIDQIKLLSVTVEDSNIGETSSPFSKDKSIIRIDRLIFSKKVPVALELLYTPYIPNQPVVEDKLHFANYLKAKEMKHAFTIKKHLCIKIEKSNDYISKKLNLYEDKEIIQIETITLNKENNLPLNFCVLYLKKEYFNLKASTPEETDTKKIF